MQVTPHEANNFLLDQFGLTPSQLEQILGTALEKRADYADLYFESRTAEAVSLEERLVKKTARSISQGAGVRVFADDRTGYAHSDEISLETLRLAARQRTIANESVEMQLSLLSRCPSPHNLYPRSRPTDISP
jgi:TldD protein